MVQKYDLWYRLKGDMNRYHSYGTHQFSMVVRKRKISDSADTITVKQNTVKQSRNKALTSTKNDCLAKSQEKREKKYFLWVFAPTSQ